MQSNGISSDINAAVKKTLIWQRHFGTTIDGEPVPGTDGWIRSGANSYHHAGVPS